MGIYKTYRNQPSHIASPVAKKAKKKKTEQSKEDWYNHSHNGERFGIYDFPKMSASTSHFYWIQNFFFFLNLPAYDLIYLFFFYLSVTGI